MTNIYFNAVFSISIALSACGEVTEPVVNPEIEEFDVDPAAQDKIDEAAASGESADGSFEIDEQDVLSINVSGTTFACGLDAGILEATVVSVDDTEMVWQMEGDSVTWTRLDNGTEGVVGVWGAQEPALVLVLSADGSVQIFGPDDLCEPERDRNQNSCQEAGLFGANITIDGDMSDWDAVGQSASLDDDQGDYSGSDAGADLRRLKVEYGDDTLYVLMQLHAPLSDKFQGRQAPNGGAYRLTVQGRNGLSLGSRIAYSPENQAWTDFEHSSEVRFAVGNDSIEWALDVSGYAGEGFESIDLILVEPIDCGAGNCESLDSMDCAFFSVP